MRHHSQSTSLAARSNERLLCHNCIVANQTSRQGRPCQADFSAYANCCGMESVKKGSDLSFSAQGAKVGCKRQAADFRSGGKLNLAALRTSR